MNIHERLKQLRVELNLTTRAFGAAINMSGGAITNMEKVHVILPNVPFVTYVVNTMSVLIGLSTGLNLCLQM